ncbi:MAG TPA: SCP2 sterol-binding domain-containing protein [Syntrophales bacterium]|nr:SCP2 sterol-binding domain-containing protein [Syntrophales bacterium]
MINTKTLLFITSFLPVATFKIIARTGDATLMQAKVAVVVGLTLAIIQLAISRKTTKHTTYLEWAFLGFLTAGTAWVYLLPASVADMFVANSTTILYFVLFLTTLLPQLFGYDPFTYAIAKQWQPETVWKTPQFKIINLHITYVFCIIMLAACLSSFVGQGKPLFAIVIPFILILAIGIPFSRLYPFYYIKNQPQTPPANLEDLPKTARELVMKMPLRFNRAVAGDLRAVIQFRFSGDGGGNLFLTISEQKCSAQEGDAPSPNLSIIAPADIWMKIAKGEINRQQAFMNGLYNVEGDMELLLRMGEIFSPQPADKRVEKKGLQEMKILAIQGSPRGRQGNTEIILHDFFKGAQKAGAQVETIYLNEKKIRPCLGCYACWTKTPGVCAIDDDMTGLLQKVRECDVIVYATPLYNYNMTALMKAFQERMLPLTDPHLIKEGDFYRHPPRYENNRKMVLISNCGFPDTQYFEGLRQVFRHLEKSSKTILVGEILVPAGELLRQQVFREQRKALHDALEQAGVELVRDGRISSSTEAIVRDPIIQPADIAEMANLWWDSYLSGKAEGLAQNSTVYDIKLVLKGMIARFNAKAAESLHAVIQFTVTGKQPGNWFVTIDEGKCTLTEGEHKEPTLTIKTPSEIWVAIANKEIDSQKAFMEGKYSVEGDMVLMMKMKNLFA